MLFTTCIDNLVDRLVEIKKEKINVYFKRKKHDILNGSLLVVFV